MKKHYETHVEDTDKLISVAGPVLDYKSWYEQYRKLMEEQAQRKYGLYTPTSEGDEDDFPSIPGMIARYSASGLANEQMKENPVWVDKTGNAHDLQMKNFAWGGMSGVGGYTESYNSNKWHKVESRIDVTWTYKSFNARSIKDNRAAQLFYQSSLSNTGFRVLSCTIKVSGLTDGQGIEYVSNGTQQFVIMRIENDGIYHLPSFDFGAKNAYYGFKFLKLQESCNITIEQLPLYPGALVFDGVDDYGTCNNFPILTKEKGYTVVALRQWITYNPNAISAIATNASDQSFNGAFTFENYNKGAEQTISYGATQITLQYSKSPFSWQTTSKYNGVNIANGNKDATNSLVLGRSYPQRNDFANFAIWELVFLDHDATEEELTKIKDYFVKTYPWLFPDQAWTVVGKTNEDEDRATIANITGNGNNLVLSNLGFAEGSGYNEEGEYAGYLVTDGVDDKITSSAFKMGKDFTVVGEWVLLQNINISSLRKDGSFVIRNHEEGLSVAINSISSYVRVYDKSLKAFCSNGMIYKSDWTEQINTNPQDTKGGNSQLWIASRSNGLEYDKIAFKNLAIYPTVLSKDDCIKAYNYLQTLKAK